ALPPRDEAIHASSLTRRAREHGGGGAPLAPPAAPPRCAPAPSVGPCVKRCSFALGAAAIPDAGNRKLARMRRRWAGSWCRIRARSHLGATREHHRAGSTSIARGGGSRWHATRYRFWRRATETSGANRRALQRLALSQ